MAESQNPIDIELEKLALEDAKVSDKMESSLSVEYLESLKNLDSTISEIDLRYARIFVALRPFYEYVKRLRALSDFPHSTVALGISMAALDNMKVTALLFYKNKLRPFLKRLCKIRVRLREKVSGLKIAPNLKELKDQLLRSRKVLADADEKVIVCESKLREVDEFISYLRSMDE